MFTYHNDNMRTGQNLNETVLTPANVNSSSFGKLFSLPLDGIAYALAALRRERLDPGPGHAQRRLRRDRARQRLRLRRRRPARRRRCGRTASSTRPHGITTVPADDTGECCDIAPEIGITSTPVIDQSTNTIYVVAKTKEVVGGTTNYVQRLHALDITTGAEKFGGPVVIQASVPGTGAGSSGGQLPFDPLHENQRTGLLLLERRRLLRLLEPRRHPAVPRLDPRLRRDDAAADARVLPHAEPGGRGRLDERRRHRLRLDRRRSTTSRGDGEFDGNTADDWGDSYIKMTTAGVVSDYFTPFNQDALEPGEPRPRLGRRTAAPRPARRAPARDGQLRQGRHDLPRRPRQHGPLQHDDEQHRPDAAEHLPERLAGARQLQRARLLRRLRLLRPARRQPPGVQADERPALDERDASLRR